MAKPHKYAWNGIDAETTLSVEQIANMAQRAAAESTGDPIKGKQSIVSARSTDREIEFRINDFLVSFTKLLVFSLDFVSTGGRTFVSSKIQWYLTNQSTMGVIPLGSKMMVAHHTYMQFVANLAAQIVAADPSARVTLREGAEPVAVQALAAAQQRAAPTPPPPAAGAPVFGGPPPPPPTTAASAVAPRPPYVAPVGSVPPAPPPGAASAGSIPPPPPPAQSAGTLPPPPPPSASALPVPPPPRIGPGAPPPPPAAMPLPPTAPSTGSALPPAPPPRQPGLVTGIPGLSVPPPPAPVEPPAPAPAPRPTDLTPLAVLMFEEDDELDTTRISQHENGRPWTIALADGQSFTLGDDVVIGRDPVSTGGARAVPVTESRKSVSKTHALFAVRDGMLWVTDLRSTNGTTVANALGEATPCPPDAAMPVGDGWTVTAGEFAVTARLDA